MSDSKVARMKRKLEAVEEQLGCCEAGGLEELLSRRELLRRRIADNLSQICSEQLALPPCDEGVVAA